MGRAALQVAESVTRERWGEYVRQLREAASRTQRQAAQAASISPSVWKGIELGRAPIEKYIETVAKATGVNAEELRARAQEIRALVESELGVEETVVERDHGAVEEVPDSLPQSEQSLTKNVTEPRRKRGRPRKEATLTKEATPSKRAKKAGEAEPHILGTKGTEEVGTHGAQGRLATGSTGKVKRAKRSRREGLVNKGERGTIEYVSDATVGTLYGARAEIERLYNWWKAYQKLDVDRRRAVDLLVGVASA